MLQNKAVSPILGVILLVALSVSLVTAFTLVSGNVFTTDDNPSVPNVDFQSSEGKMSIQLLDSGDASRVYLKPPEDSNLVKQYLDNVGETKEITVTENNTGTYRLIAENEDGNNVLVDKTDVGNPAEDDVENLKLVLLQSTVEGGEDSISFDVKNTGEEEAEITHFKLQERNLNDIILNAGSSPGPPGRSGPPGSGTDNELIMDSSSGENGYCGNPPGQVVPMNDKHIITTSGGNPCVSQSSPSVAGSGATIEFEFNGIESNSKDTEYVGVSPEDAYTDLEVILYGSRGESIAVPLIFDAFVIPKDNSPSYDSDLDPSTFTGTEASTIILLEDKIMKGNISDLSSSTVYFNDRSTSEGDIRNVGSVTGQDRVEIQGNLEEAEDVFLGFETDVADVKDVDSFYVGSSSETGKIQDVDGDVTIGEDSVVTDDIDNVAGDVNLEDNVEVQGDVKNVGGTVNCGSGVTTQNSAC